MVYINEWFPNPVGKDDPAEFIELFNRSSSSIHLDGWKLWTGKGKTFSLSGYSMGPGGYLVLKKAQTKFSLKNMDGALFLYGPVGEMADHAAFVGTAPEGQSFSRVDYGTADTEHFSFVDPTPGGPNKAINNQIAVRQYPFGVPLNLPLGAFQLVEFMIGVAVVMVGAWAYIIHSYEKLSKLIFERDAEAR